MDWKEIWDRWNRILAAFAAGALVVGIAWALFSRSNGNHRCALIPQSGVTVCRSNDTPKDSAKHHCRFTGSGRWFSYYRCEK